MDDILIIGRNVADYDSVLEAVLQQAKSYNLGLNFDKVEVRKPEVQYVGHIISAEGLKPDPEKSESHEGYATSRNKRGCTPIPGIHTIFG